MEIAYEIAPDIDCRFSCSGGVCEVDVSEMQLKILIDVYWLICNVKRCKMSAFYV